MEPETRSPSGLRKSVGRVDSWAPKQTQTHAPGRANGVEAKSKIIAVHSEANFSAGKSRVEPLATRPCCTSSLPKSTLPHQASQCQHSRPTNIATCTSHGATQITDIGIIPAASQSYHHADPVDSLPKLSPSPLARQAQVNRRKAAEERQNEHANKSQPFRLSAPEC